MDREIWMWLASGLGHGAVNSGELLNAYPEGPQAIADNLGDERLDDILTQKQAERLASTRPADFALDIAHAKTQGVDTLAFDEPRYPDMLRRIHNPPLVLFVKGDTALLNGQLTIGMVGARRPSAYGVEAVKAIGRGVALGGAIIVSGLAAGLDAEAHKAALAVNGPTIACIAFGHDTCYPAANRKLMEVIERYGLVVSEYPLGTGAEKPYFLHRNRLIAGLSHGLVVGEARRHSGTMSTVNFATDYGRDVFAVPGSIFSELSSGTNDMIREGAFLAGNAGDILGVYGIEMNFEDPVVAATKQAAEGRPVAANAAPAPWQQNLARQTAQSSPDNEPKKDQTLGEAMQQRLGSAGAVGPVSGKQAMEAFRRLQDALPAAGNETDVRGRALDEMVAAVSDSVEISDTGIRSVARTQASPAKPKDKPHIRPFEWNRVEHLNKREIEKMSAAPEQSKPKKSAPIVAPAVQPSAPRSSAPVERIQPVERIERAQSVQPVQRAAPVAPAAAPSLAAEGKAAQNPATPKPAPTPRKETFSMPEQRPAAAVSASLSGKLRTLQSAMEYTQPDESDGMDEPDMHDVLSSNAKQALRQLGPAPVSLTQICEAGGLSPGEAMAALTELELAGFSRQLAGRQFIIG